MKKIIGFDNYLINEFGEIINIKTGRVLKIQKNKKNYSIIQISINGFQKTKFIHRLVYQNFKGVIPEKMEINHIDGDKDNNHISNLELTTHKENIEKAVEIGLIKTGEDSYNSRQVISINVLDESIVSKYGSIRLAEKHTGISSGNISQVCLGKRKTAGGYKWKYIN